MATPHTFEELEAWQAARELTNEAFRLSRRDPLARDFVLCSQFRRAALSTMNNIAEGWETLHKAEKKQFYNWSRRSCGEVRSMSYVLFDNDFISVQEQKDLQNYCVRTGKLVSGLIRSLDNRN
jgi:four helix bundle protein